MKKMHAFTRSCFKEKTSGSTANKIKITYGSWKPQSRRLLNCGREQKGGTYDGVRSSVHIDRDQEPPNFPGLSDARKLAALTLHHGVDREGSWVVIHKASSSCISE